MAIKHTKYKYIFCAIFAALTLGITAMFANSVRAAEQKAAIQLQVTPTKQKLSLEPGQTYESSYTIMNIGALEFTYTAEATPYSVNDQTYGGNYETRKNYNQIADWITFNESEKTGKIQPGQSKEVHFTINVPKDTPAGGQYAAIMASTSDGNTDDANIKTVNRVGMILYASVAGKTRDEGSIKSNNIPGFLFEGPLAATALVENTGNVENTAKYTFRVWPLFGKETVYNNEESPVSLDIIPETTRFSSISWEEISPIGIYWAQQIVDYAGQTDTVEKFVIICPLWLLFVIFALIFFIIFWLVSRARGRKRGNRESRRSSSRRSSSADSEKSDKKEEKSE